MATENLCNMLRICLILAAFCWLRIESLTPIYNGLLAKDQGFYILTPLLYDNGDLEPFINEETVFNHNEVFVNHNRKKVNQMFKAWRKFVSTRTKVIREIKPRQI